MSRRTFTLSEASGSERSRRAAPVASSALRLRPAASAQGAGPSKATIESPPAVHRIDHGALVAAEHGLHHSPEWPRVEKLHLSREPRCRCCADHAKVTAVQVHHIFPFHYCIALGRPDLELDLRNLITLCESEAGRPAEDHHLLVGHLGSFRSSNLEVARDARHRFHALEAEVIKRLPSWLHEVSARLAPLEEMSARERREFARLMNQRLPKNPTLAFPPRT